MQTPWICKGERSAISWFNDEEREKGGGGGERGGEGGGKR